MPKICVSLFVMVIYVCLFVCFFFFFFFFFLRKLEFDLNQAELDLD
jgi:hypothetical protein